MHKNFSKSEFISIVSNELELPAGKAELVLNKLIHRVQEILSTYGEITLSGLGNPITITHKSKTIFIPENSDEGNPLNDLPKPDFFPEASTLDKPSGSEQRNLKRQNFIIDLEVIDMESNQIIGDVGDITPEGLMLVSEQPIEESKRFKFKIAFPEDAEIKMQIEFEAESIRCVRTIHESIFTTGFKIENPDSENLLSINKMIKRYAV